MAKSHEGGKKPAERSHGVSKKRRKPQKGGKKPAEQLKGVSKNRSKLKYDKKTRVKKSQRYGLKSMQRASAAPDKAERLPQVALLGETLSPCICDLHAMQPPSPA